MTAILGFREDLLCAERKTLVNNLRGIAAPEKVKETLADFGLSAAARAEQLSVALLRRCLRNYVSSSISVLGTICVFPPR